MATKVINIRIDDKLYNYLQTRAEQEYRTLSNMIILILMTEKERVINKTYQQGICDSWKYAQWIVKADENVLEKVFGTQDEYSIIGDNSVKECMSKINDYYMI